MNIYVSFKDMYGEQSTKELLLLTHYSPSQHHLKVWTSTKNAKVYKMLLSIIYVLNVISFYLV